MRHMPAGSTWWVSVWLIPVLTGLARYLRHLPNIMGKGKVEKNVFKKPVTKVLKKPHGAIIAKKGKARFLKRPCSNSQIIQKGKTVAYVQNNEKEPKVSRWCVNQKNLLRMPEHKAITMLKKLGWLKLLKECPECSTKLVSCRTKGNTTYQSRCPSRGCQKRILWTHGHPLLHQNNTSIPIGHQAAVYLGILLGCSQHALAVQFDTTRSNIEKYVDRIKQFVASFVLKQQAHITFGNDGNDWQEVEVDEVTLSKTLIDKKKYRWGNFIGLIARGVPRSLWISRLPDRDTALRAPGPGPIRSKDWEPIAKALIDNKGVILHSDSARAYKKNFRRMARTMVIHCKKWKNGVWVRPHFTKVRKVDCNGKAKYVKSGTQMIDGVWSLMRKGKWGSHGSNALLERSVRWVQWRYWNQGQDLFHVVGGMIKKHTPWIPLGLLREHVLLHAEALHSCLGLWLCKRNACKAIIIREVSNRTQIKIWC